MCRRDGTCARGWRTCCGVELEGGAACPHAATTRPNSGRGRLRPKPAAWGQAAPPGWQLRLEKPALPDALRNHGTPASSVPTLAPAAAGPGCAGVGAARHEVRRAAWCDRTRLAAGLRLYGRQVRVGRGVFCRHGRPDHALLPGTGGPRRRPATRGPGRAAGSGQRPLARLPPRAPRPHRAETARGRGAIVAADDGRGRVRHGAHGLPRDAALRHHVRW